MVPEPCEMMPAVNDALTYSIEIAVGLACVAGAAVMWGSMKILAAVLATAGFAAIVHAALALTT